MATALFNRKTLARRVALAGPPDPARVAALKAWADGIASGRVASLKETALHGPFMQLMIDGFGYRGPIGGGEFTITQEQAIIQGSVDLALGHFANGHCRVVAPFELKGADTKNLDAVMAGRAKTPVDQAWEYATGNPGTKWVLVTNYLELRLYAYGEGRQAYELFDLRNLHERDAYARAQLLLSAEALLGGGALALLDESRRENKDITDRLYADYKGLRAELIGEVRRALPDLDPALAIRTGQKVLDRVLFVAFAEDRGLLPPRILERAFETRNAFAPTPVWDNFAGLFRAIDQGAPPLQVPRYNGGLFAPDVTIDALAMPDHICAGFKRLADYDFASEVSVTVLGHIFEQSIADIEQLQAEFAGHAPAAKKASGTSGRRKRDGVVYTPDYIARFIVERTLGAHAGGIFDVLLAEHAAKGATRDDKPIRWRSVAAERAFWAAYRDRLATLRIVDPACGSGVFLVMAFDWLKVELTKCSLALEKLGVGALGEPDSEILTRNLFGVDVNEESVEIAKLSLWIKTARHGKVLDSLDQNFRVGDSLIEDSNYAYRKHGFVWRDAFPGVFAEGGFDVVLGNPPYVAMGLFKDLKKWLARFEVAADRADLYAYFFERGLKLLKAGGRLGYISSSTFFKTGAGAPLRDFLRQNATIETVIDFGDLQVFEGVTTYPVIVTMRAGAPSADHRLLFWNVDTLTAESFDKAFDTAALPFAQADLDRGSWELEDQPLRRLREKLGRVGRPLKEVYGAPLYGIKTGLNGAFVIDAATKERLCAADPRSAALLRPFLEGEDLRRWHVVNRNLWIIYIPKNRVEIEDYPAVREWLLPFRDQLKARATDQRWFELQQAQEKDISSLSGKAKLIYPEFSQGRKFSIDNSKAYFNNKAFFLPASWFLLSLLNSTTLWFLLSGLSAAMRGGEWRLELRKQYVETVPIPPATDDQKAELAALAEAAQTAAERRYRLQQQVTCRIPDLAPAGKPAKLTERLKAWWDLPDFAAFQAEVKKALRTDIPLKARNEWEGWLAEIRPEIAALSAEIARFERLIDARVYALFGLTPDEIALLEANS